MSPAQITMQADPPAPAPPRRRWYGHGWNVPLSWELILRVTPRLPRFVLWPLRVATTAVCYACMPRERAAARRNLERVTGKHGLSSRWLVYRLFYNFSHFMVAYTEMKDLDFDRFARRLDGLEETRRIIGDAIQGRRGVILGTMHIGQWDLGLRLLSHFGVPVHVVMLSEDSREVSRYADEARHFPLLRVHQTGRSPLLAVELMTALKRGEIVAIQIDRAAGSGVMPIDLFGGRTDLPTGPAQLAMATGAPLVPVFVLLGKGGRYRLLAHEPMRFDRHRGPMSEMALRHAMGRIAATIESVVSRYPDQWFNFYDVWAEPSAGRSADAAGG